MDLYFLYLFYTLKNMTTYFFHIYKRNIYLSCFWLYTFFIFFKVLVNLLPKLCSSYLLHSSSTSLISSYSSLCLHLLHFFLLFLHFLHPLHESQLIQFFEYGIWFFSLSSPSSHSLYSSYSFVPPFWLIKHSKKHSFVITLNTI